MTPHVLIAITMTNGTVTVMTFITESRSPTLPVGAIWLNHSTRVWRRAPTDENIAAELRKAFPVKNQVGIAKPQPVKWTIVEASDLPKDRTYRNAWRHDGQRFTHDMDHARKIHMEHIRHARTEHLGKLDREWMRATGQGDATLAAAIEAERQVLRDIPLTLPLGTATTPEELKALWPEGLPLRHA